MGVANLSRPDLIWLPCWIRSRRRLQYFKPVSEPHETGATLCFFTPTSRPLSARRFVPAYKLSGTFSHRVGCLWCAVVDPISYLPCILWQRPASCVQVTVELKNDLAIAGTLHSVDQYLNVKLHNTRVINEQKYPHMVCTTSCLCAANTALVYKLGSLCCGLLAAAHVVLSPKC